MHTYVVADDSLALLGLVNREQIELDPFLNIHTRNMYTCLFSTCTLCQVLVLVRTGVTHSRQVCSSVDDTGVFPSGSRGQGAATLLTAMQHLTHKRSAVSSTCANQHGRHYSVHTCYNEKNSCANRLFHKALDRTNSEIPAQASSRSQEKLNPAATTCTKNRGCGGALNTGHITKLFGKNRPRAIDGRVASMSQWS